MLDAVALENRAAPPPLADDALRQVFARAQDEEHDGHTPASSTARATRPTCAASRRRTAACAGTVVSAPVANSVRVRLRAELSAGDGVAFGAAASEAGGALWAVHAHSGDEVTLELEDPRKLVGVRPGQLVWRTQHAALQRQLKTALADASAGRALVDVALSGEVGEPLTVKVTDGRGRSASAQTEAVIEAAAGEGLGEAAVAKAVGQLGGSPLLLRHLDVDGALAAGGGAGSRCRR